MAQRDPVRQAEDQVIGREINYALRLDEMAWMRLEDARQHLAEVRERQAGKGQPPGERSA